MLQNSFVIDVNVYISYILKGKLDELFLFVLERDFEVFISKDLIAELIEVLQRKKFEKYLKISPYEFAEAVQQFGFPTEPGRVKVQSPDSKDDYLFMLALHTESTIVTGDKELLNWKKTPVPVISLAKFKQLNSFIQ